MSLVTVSPETCERQVERNLLDEETLIPIMNRDKLRTNEKPQTPPPPSADMMQEVIDGLLRYHRNNPLRVAFGTNVLLAQHSGEQIQEAYDHLVSDGKMEPVYHKVFRKGRSWTCYRITKEGMADDETA